MEVVLLAFAWTFVLWSEGRPGFRSLGSVVTAYGCGLLLSLLPVPLETVAQGVAEVSIALAMVLLLFSARKSLVALRPLLLGFLLMILSVGLAVALCAPFFSEAGEASVQGAMLFGLFTGTVATMNAVGISLNAPSETVVAMTSIDAAVGGGFLLFLLVLAPKLFAKVLPVPKSASAEGEHGSKKLSWARAGASLLLAGAVLGASAGLSVLLFGKVQDVVVLFSLTALAVAVSFTPLCRESYEADRLGNALLLLFCIALGSLVHWATFADIFTQMLGYMCAVLLLAVFIHLIFAKMFGLDRDGYLITLTAGLYGPPFIAPVAKALNNSALIAPGIACGVFGMILGNMMSPLMYGALEKLLN